MGKLKIQSVAHKSAQVMKKQNVVNHHPNSVIKTTAPTNNHVSKISHTLNKKEIVSKNHQKEIQKNNNKAVLAKKTNKETKAQHQNKTSKQTLQKKVKVKGLPSVKAVAKATGYSESFINSLIQIEGLKLQSYRDTAGHQTIGVGHNIDADKHYKYGKTITKEIAYLLLKDDLLAVKQSIAAKAGNIKLSQKQTEGLTDLVFNVGPGCLDAKFMGDIKKRNFEAAATEFNFICADKKVNPGLCLRRLFTIKLFSEGKLTEKITAAAKKIVLKGNETYDKRLASAQEEDTKKKILEQKINYWNNAKRTLGGVWA